jgi:hypothetical protein
MNRWDIPLWLKGEVLKRDKNCVYCQVKPDGKVNKKWRFLRGTNNTGTSAPSEILRDNQ